MSTLFLVRHGQASFGQANYDRLSELGWQQMGLLGDYWVRVSLALDAVYTGTLERQRASAEAVAGAFRAASRPFPAVSAHPEFNEYDSQKILTGSIPAVVAEHPEIAALVKEFAPAGGAPDLVNNRRAFQRLFSKVMDLWVEGKLAGLGMESWGDFTTRVGAGVDRIIREQGAGKNVAVFSSGGPISAVMQKALGCADKIALELGWVIANGSLTEFRYSAEKFSLVAFNSTPHLAELKLISYR